MELLMMAGSTIGEENLSSHQICDGCPKHKQQVLLSCAEELQSLDES
jgi:hypothetical protein